MSEITSDDSKICNEINGNLALKIRLLKPCNELILLDKHKIKKGCVHEIQLIFLYSVIYKNN